MFNSLIDHRPIGSLHVAELAQQANVTPATIRYYSRVGLISPGREPENGYRCFSAADLHRVEFIRQAQSVGLRIGDIKAVLETIDQGETPCQQVRSLVEQRLITVQQKIAELQATEARIGVAFETWQEMHDETPVDGELCPLIERLTSANVGVTAAPRRHDGEQNQACQCTNARSVALSASA